MPNLPILTKELLFRLERHMALYGRPERDGLQIAQFGQTVALKRRGRRPANNVFCFGEEDLGQLDAILTFYAEDGIRPSFYLSPLGFGREVGAALHKAGFAQFNFDQAILYGVPRAEPVSTTPGIKIEPVTDQNLEAYLEAKSAGFEWHPSWREYAKDGERRALGTGDTLNFLATYEGDAAGAASLSIRESIANLFDCAVSPQMRGQGCQMALLQHRLHVAHELDATLVVSGASFGSVSFRNQLRAGLQLAYIESGWKSVSH